MVTRENGFASAVEITAVDLPEGVSVEPIMSEAKGATAKEVKLKLTAANDAVSGPFRIIGHLLEDDANTVAQFSIGDTLQTHTRLWLTVR